MITIRLIDARRELSLKCRELFANERIAKEIYGYLSDGLEECDEVEPERKKGEWIDLWDRYRCSVCNMEHNYEENFCPNCGADMRGEKNETD